jgi:hypothetical protein
LLGEELGEHYRSKLEPIYGKNWVADLAKQRNDPPYNLTDPAWVLKGATAQFNFANAHDAS